ncbi:MAG: hypothetical protein ACO2O3_03075, partial [Thermocrinis sp.]
SDAFVARLNSDLTQILQSTYLGGSGEDYATALAIHPKTGEIYVAGVTKSKDFPQTAGGAQEWCSKWVIYLIKSCYDVFVARLNKDLTQILQTTYLGGSDEDYATALAIHPKTGEVYVAGVTSSKNFPKTTGGAQAVYGGGDRDAFVARLNKELTQILRSTYLGGSSDDGASALAIHPKTGEVYVAGRTKSIDFPDAFGGAQGSRGGKGDAFVARLNSNLTQILQSTYLGGSENDYAYALAIHPKTGEVYVVGETYSTNFPNTIGGAQGRHGGGEKDAFVARLNKELTQILQSTYLGGNNWDVAYALVLHPKTGEVYVAGYTFSTDFPRTSGGAQVSYRGLRDAFVARLNKELTQILQSTYLGGNDWDSANALAIHPTTGEVYVAGGTSSENFPKTTGGAQVVYGGGDWDTFVARLNKELTQILQSTYLGGSRYDGASALAIHPKTGEIYVAGHTLSDDFPKTACGAQTECNECITFEYSGSGDAFVARLSADLSAGNGSDSDGSGSGGGCGYPMTGSKSSRASLAFVVARRIRRR